LGLRHVYQQEYRILKFQVGDCVVAKRGEKEQAGVIFKVSDVSSETYPDRNIFSVRFQDNIQVPVTFIWEPDSFWQLPDKTPFESYIREIMRGETILWTEE